MNDIDAIYDAMLADLGVAVVPEWKANEDVTAGRVESLMPEYYPMPLNINIVYPQTRFLSQRARSFIDFLVGCLKRA
ncbi:hypothetical protein L810_7890 [Burkholderia sp. AU4i]|nr:hypothetical protein L810_7890 [Burkholderia sp. AU4i]